MDDPHRKPREQDRAALVARIRRAAEDGRIAPADRDIRVGNVASAQSMAELDLMGRDLDQLDALAPAAAGAPSWTGPSPTPAVEEVTDLAVDAARSTARSIGLVAAVIAVLALVGVGGSALVVLHSSGGHQGGALKDPIPVTPSVGVTIGGADGSTTAPAGSTYSLSVPGIRAFLDLYRTHFHTSRVVDLTLYADYAVVDVPVPGTSRHEGWIFRANGFTNFGGVTTNAPGLVPVDTRRISVPALVRNIARARTTLKVEHPTTTYVIVRHDATFDPVPSVAVYVANRFNETGYLATRLDGTVERAYPFGQ